MLYNLATSKTNYLRSSGDPVVNTVYIQQNFVHIAWSVIAAPVTFTALYLLFSIGIMLWSSYYCSGDRGPLPPVWKSSLMAGVHSLDPHPQKSVGGMKGQAVMSEKAHEMFAHLDRDGGGWWLVDAGGQGRNTKEYLALAGHNGKISGNTEVQG